MDCQDANYQFGSMVSSLLLKDGKRKLDPFWFSFQRFERCTYHFPDHCPIITKEMCVSGLGVVSGWAGLARL